MTRRSKEYQAFTSLVDQLLTVPKDEIVRRERKKAASETNRRLRTFLRMDGLNGDQCGYQLPPTSYHLSPAYRLPATT
jgi:hypothetical protein